MTRDYTLIYLKEFVSFLWRVCPEIDWFENIYKKQGKLLLVFGHSATCSFRFIWSIFVLHNIR